MSLLTSFEPDAIHVSIAAAAQECGIPLNADYNGASQDGVSFMQYSIEDGVRHSTAAAYIRPVEADPNLEVVIGATARRLLFDGTRCVGVEWSQDGRIERVRAAADRRVRRDDRVCAAAPALGGGACGSPALARDRRRRRPARSRREPARPPALTGHLQRRARGRASVHRPARLPDPPLLALAARFARARHPADPLHGPDVRAVDGRARERLHAAGWNGPARKPRLAASHRAGAGGPGRARPERPRV